jgi:hypothetical protein
LPIPGDDVGCDENALLIEYFSAYGLGSLLFLKPRFYYICDFLGQWA